MYLSLYFNLDRFYLNLSLIYFETSQVRFGIWEDFSLVNSDDC